MRQIRIALTMLALTTAAVAPASAQTPDADCQAGRERLAGHARASEAVRKVLSARAGTAPAAGAPGAAAAPGGRAAEIRTRLGEIPRERQRLDDVRVGAMVKLDFARAAQAQGQLETLDLERRRLERELATMPQSPSAPAPSPPAAPPTGAIDADRVPCRDVATTLDAALRARRRELGAREAQAGAIPLAPLRSQTATAVARELAAQFAAWPEAASQVGLLDQDGKGRIDAVVDSPAKDVFRVIRLRADGSLGVEVFAADAATAAAYGETTRRLEEATLRRSARRLEDVLVTRPAGAIRVMSETAESRRTLGRLLAGEFAEAAKAESGARALEFENLRGETVRVLELLTPTATGLDWRRVVVVAAPGVPEQWEETTLRLKPVSYWRTDAELTIARETRSAAGAAGPRAVTGPVTFSVER